MKIAGVTTAMDCDVQLLEVRNVIVTDICGGKRVSQISCILDSTCNKNLMENLENFNVKI